MPASLDARLHVRIDEVEGARHAGHEQRAHLPLRRQHAFQSFEGVDEKEITVLAEASTRSVIRTAGTGGVDGDYNLARPALASGVL